MERLRVLVADDEAGMRHSIRRALENFSFHVPEIEDDVAFDIDTVDNGEEALEAIDANAPDILLLDQKMGGITGTQVLETMVQRQWEVLTVMITAFATIETAVKATKKGAYDFLAKPFTPPELKETVRKAAQHLIVHRQARKLAAEKRRVRFEFIRVLGHELKAPLAAIENYLDIMQSQTAGPNIADYSEIIDRCLVRAGGMRKLIADLLDMTRIESGQKKRELTTVNLAEAVKDAVDGVAVAARDRGIEIASNLDDYIEMTADRGEIDIILNNLVSNAVKYNRDNGRVDIQVTGDDELVTITVADTGIGMSQEDAERLFNDFVRIKNEKTKNILGSGLGLSIVKKIAGLYQGRTLVESNLDVGSKFTVTLKRNSSAE